tara:strand:- start:4807 stop:5031 length:225 start_codon:yes stop_codon:yes gene_type:complete
MIKEIFEGWKNYIVKTPLVEAEAKRRAEICASCEHAKDDLGVPRCGICNCPLAMKTRSAKSECPNPQSKGGPKW